MNIKLINLRLLCLGIAFASPMLMGCTAHQNHDNKKQFDPFEDFNRRMFDFNYNIMDRYIIRSAAVAWRDYIPKPARNGLKNFFKNLEEPASVVNYLFVGNLYKAMLHFNLFFLNTMLGMGGFIDVAAMVNPKLAIEETRRFGSTLGNYGIGYGPYMQIPGYGSFTFREDFGGLVDNLYPLLSYLTWWMSVGKWILEGLEMRSQLLAYDSFLHNSQDPYSIVRIAYFQRYDFLSSNNLSAPQEKQDDAIIGNDLYLIDT